MLLDGLAVVERDGGREWVRCGILYRGQGVGARADDPLEVIARVLHDLRIQADPGHDDEALGEDAVVVRVVGLAAHDVDRPGVSVQCQAQGGVGVQGHAEVAGEQVAGARGQQRHGRAGACQLG